MARKFCLQRSDFDSFEVKKRQMLCFGEVQFDLIAKLSKSKDTGHNFILKMFFI